MKVLALIPARSGSKSVPHKNIKEFKGIPLMCHSIEHAKKSKLINRVILSTDSEEYAEIGRKHGAETPFLRPSEYAQDISTDFEVFKHALEWLKENEDYEPDIVVQLRPTTPIRNIEVLDEAIQKFIDRPEADSLRSVIKWEGPTPYKMWNLKGDFLSPLLKLESNKEPYNSPRQDLPYVYWQNANIDITKPSTVLTKGSMTGEKIMAFVMKPEDDVDIDSEKDFQEASEK